MSEGLKAIWAGTRLDHIAVLALDKKRVSAIRAFHQRLLARSDKKANKDLLQVPQQYPDQDDDQDEFDQVHDCL